MLVLLIKNEIKINFTENVVFETQSAPEIFQNALNEAKQIRKNGKNIANKSYISEEDPL